MKVNLASGNIQLQSLKFLSELIMTTSLAFYGPLIHSLGPDKVEIVDQALVVVQDGKISTLRKDVPRDQVESVFSSLNLNSDVKLRYLSRGEFLIPGFVDTHNHAPQWAMRGLGRGLHILEWLDQVTFPNEAKFKDPDYARRIYSDCVDGFIQQGITTVSYYGSLHGEATKILAEICLAKGQRAFVGKCNMDRNAPDYYRDMDTEESLRVTEDCIAHIRSIDPKADLVTPILTPRFAICCNNDLLTGLGEIASRNPDLPIQTHFNEAEQEINSTLGLFPEFTNEADLYEHFGLLSRKSILAHCTHMTDYEMTKLRELDCGVAHCPIANTTVGGGFMAAPIREFLRRGIKVGLGTDSGGGFSSSILDAMRQAFIVSNAKELMTKGKDPSLSLEECFYMATLGGARVCCLDEQVGNFEVGKQFDALVVSTVKQKRSLVNTMTEDGDSLRMTFEKFLMSGDDRNITEVYARGRLIGSQS
ncbi:MAG: guanine deaminase [Deltaproteobacteria bacterium]|nr:guanine deaminase [Deltaproteobacteria bacterium]